MVYGSLGFACLALGVVGSATPVLPTVEFLLLAAFFFSRSSRRMHDWLLSNRRFGPLIDDYRNGLGMRRRMKVVALITLAVSFGLSTVFFIERTLWRVVMVAIGVSVAAFIITRPTTEVVLAERER